MKFKKNKTGIGRKYEVIIKVQLSSDSDSFVIPTAMRFKKNKNGTGRKYEVIIKVQLSSDSRYVRCTERLHFLA